MAASCREISRQVHAWLILFCTQYACTSQFPLKLIKFNIDGALTFIHVCDDSSRNTTDPSIHICVASSQTVLEHHRPFHICHLASQLTMAMNNTISTNMTMLVHINGKHLLNSCQNNFDNCSAIIAHHMQTAPIYGTHMVAESMCMHTICCISTHST